MQCEIDKHKIVQIRQIFWKIDFESKMPKMDCITKFQSCHLNIFRKFRKPVTRAKGHLSVITKVVSARELRYERGRSWIEHPHSPDQRLPSTNHDVNLIYIICFCSDLLGWLTMWCAHKYRLFYKNWNALIHVCFLNFSKNI